MKFDLYFLILISLLLFFNINTTKVFKSEVEFKSLSTFRSILSLNKDLFEEAKAKINPNKKDMNFAKLFSFKSTSTLKTKAKLRKSTSQVKLDLSNPCIVDDNSCPNLMIGWLKFLEITEVLPDVPNTFIKNKKFYIQQAQNQSMNTVVKDNYGFINIPNEDYFYFELNKYQLKVYTARAPRYRTLYKTLNIQELISETSLNPCKGGVEDVGNFSEGFCFMLKFSQFNRFFIWEVCSDNAFEKDKWMTTLAKLNEMNKTGNLPLPKPILPHSFIHKEEHNVLPIQSITSTMSDNTINPLPVLQGYGSYAGLPVINSAGGAIEVAGAVLPNHLTSMGPTVSSTVLTNNGNAITIEAQHGPGWVPASGWSLCSEPCGPGIQTRKLKCILDDGCNGADQEEKMCKLKECKKDLENHLIRLNTVAECGQWKLLGDWTPCSKPCGGGFQFRKRECMPANLPCVGKAQITQPCNTQPCRPEDQPDCKQIEGQLNMILEMGKNPVPVHLIININEITISQEPLLAPLAQIPLSQIDNLKLLKSNPGCFALSSNNQQHQNFSLCPEHRELTECEKWMNKIQKFKENCNNKILERITSDIEKGNCADPQKKLEELNKNALLAEKQKTASKIQDLDNKMNDFKRQVNEILDKEDAYEKGLEEQEKIKECKEKKATDDLIRKQQEAARMLLDDMTNLNRQDNEYSLREKAIKRQMKSMMDDVKKKIADKRSGLVSKIQRMKTIHDLEQKKAAHRLLDMKKQFGKQIGDLSKKGNPNVCFNLMDQHSIDNYCDHTFKSGDFNLDCKSHKNFCYLCCDHEVGSFDHENLECCYNRCEAVNAKRSMSGSQCNGFLESYHLPDVVTSVASTTNCAGGNCANNSAIAAQANNLFN